MEWGEGHKETPYPTSPLNLLGSIKNVAILEARIFITDKLGLTLTRL